MSKPKLRPLGNILLDMELLYLELMIQHELQYSDIIGIFKQYNETHELDKKCLEHYNDGTTPVLFYGHKDNLKCLK